MDTWNTVYLLDICDDDHYSFILQDLESATIDIQDQVWFFNTTLLLVPQFIPKHDPMWHSHIPYDLRVRDESTI